MGSLQGCQESSHTGLGRCQAAASPVFSGGPTDPRIQKASHPGQPQPGAFSLSRPGDSLLLAQSIRPPAHLDLPGNY